jgi:hypothetical protein
MMTGCSSLRIASFAYRIDKPDEAANVDRLDWAAVWYCQDITLPGIGHLQSLYKALGETGNPEFGTVMRIVRALGLTLSARPASTGRTTRRRRVA